MISQREDSDDDQHDHKGHHQHKHGGFSTEGSFDAKKAFNLMDINKGERILDAGCGNGYLSLIASRLVGSDGMIFAFDIHEQSIEKLRKSIEFGPYHNIKVGLHDLKDPLPIEDGSLDRIIFSNVFHGIIINGELPQVLKGIESKLGEGGRISLIEFIKARTPMGPDLSERFSPEDLARIFTDIDLEMGKVHLLSDDHYLVNFRRNERDRA